MAKITSEDILNIGKKEIPNNGKHYKELKYEPNKVIKDWVEINNLKGYEAYTYGQVLKYLSRVDLKESKEEDIQKAMYYLYELKKEILGSENGN